MNRIKAIRTEADYKEALSLLEQLIDAEYAPGTDGAEQVEILSTLIESYEDKYFPEELPSPLEAIQFKMEQMDLTAKDLIPYIGGKSRVSEVLSGKRGLSLEMIRELEAGLGIPANILVQKQVSPDADEYDVWDKKVFNEMKKRGYFEGLMNTPAKSSDLLREFFQSVKGADLRTQTLLRQSSYRTLRANRYALAAWTGFVLKEADAIFGDIYRSEPRVDIDFMQKIAKLSIHDDGPKRAQKILFEHGIILVIEPSLPGTRLDGATIIRKDRMAVIAITLRYDRLDNFWFTLLHELAHIAKHRSEDEYDLFFDELFADSKFNISEIEAEADKMAASALVSDNVWELSPAKLVPSPITANLLAKQQGIHIAVVVGKIRYETGKWSAFSKIVEQHKVRYLYPGKAWSIK